MSRTCWWGITVLAESILGAEVETGTGRFDLGTQRKEQQISNPDCYFLAPSSSPVFDKYTYTIIEKPEIKPSKMLSKDTVCHLTGTQHGKHRDKCSLEHSGMLREVRMCLWEGL